MNNDLISRSALKERWTIASPEPYTTDAAEVLASIDEAPAVDAVEVVRCRNCVNWKKATVSKDGFLICPKSGMKIMARTYCSYGDRGADHD
jgi:hypothetical protein